MGTDLSMDAQDTRRQMEAAATAAKVEKEQKTEDAQAQTHADARADLEVLRAGLPVTVPTAPETNTTTTEHKAEASEAPPSAPATTPPATPATASGDTSSPEKLGVFASLMAGAKSLGSFISEKFSAFTEWLKNTPFAQWLKEKLGIKADDQATDKLGQPSSWFSLENSPVKLLYKTWEEITVISDKSARVVQAALLAFATDMNCFTKDGNHCSGWCDSVFNKAGLSLYDPALRVYVGDYKNWPKKGQLEGLKLEPGDSLLRYNNNRATGYHQEIVLASEGPDAEGNYTLTTVGQLSVKGDSGVRKIRTVKVAAQDIRAVIRPNANG